MYHKFYNIMVCISIINYHGDFDILCMRMGYRYYDVIVVALCVRATPSCCGFLRWEKGGQTVNDPLKTYPVNSVRALASHSTPIDQTS